MKKIIGVAFAFVVAASALFAGPFGDLLKTTDSLTGSSSEPVEGALSGDRELLPILWSYVFEETKPEGKVVGGSATFKSFNPVANEYVFYQEVIFKFGIGLQKQSSLVAVKGEGQKFTVQTKSMKSCTVDKSGKEMTAGTEHAAKSMTQNSKNIAQDLANKAKSFSNDEYKKWSDEAFFNLKTQVAVYETAENTLKAKKWYSAHNMEGQNVSGGILVASVDESKVKGYAYVVKGFAIGLGIPEKTLVEFNTNKDSNTDLRAGDTCSVSGVAKKVDYVSSVGYYISKVQIDE